MPRNLELEELIGVLEQEHVKAASDLAEIRGMLSRREYEGVRSRLTGLDQELLQHMLDEEASVLRVFIQAFGIEGSREAIEVFQEHVDIREMIVQLAKDLEISQLSSDELGSKLDRFMNEHFRKEDDRIFPLAIETKRTLSEKRSKTIPFDDAARS